jgi:hypothetical protein
MNEDIGKKKLDKEISIKNMNGCALDIEIDKFGGNTLSLPNLIDCGAKINIHQVFFLKN